jgi:hypothetical protein
MTCMTLAQLCRCMLCCDGRSCSCCQLDRGCKPFDHDTYQAGLGRAGSCQGGQEGTSTKAQELQNTQRRWAGAEIKAQPDTFLLSALPSRKAAV